MKSNLKKLLSQELQTLSQKILEFKSENFFKLCVLAEKALKNKNKIMFIGNGGSAADAQHLATELTVRYKKKKRSALSAISLATDTSAITAIGNDFDFSKIFSRQIEAIGQSGDVLLAISTSGNSKNIVEALKICKNKNIKSFAFLGNKGGISKKYCDFPIIFPEASTSITQSMQITVGQVLCDYLEQTLKK